MAKKTKAQKTQAAQEALTNALSDNKLTKDEIKAIKNLDGGDAFKQYSTSLLDKIKAGDADTLKLLGASDLNFGTSIFNNKALKGTDYYQFGADILNKAAKDKPIDFNFSPEMNKLAATLYQAAGDEKLVDPRWLAEANGQNTYKDKDGNYKLTSVGEGAFDTGRNSAEDLDAYRKQFYADNFTNKFLNPDGSLTADGQQAFNDFWDQSGISNRAKALEAFQQQVNPLYQSPTGTTPTNSDVNLPTGVGDMNEWAANNLVGTTTAPLSQQNLDALKSGEDVAKSNIDAGDKNAPIRDMLMNYAKGGGINSDITTMLNDVKSGNTNNPYLATASTIDPTKLAGSTAYLTNPYISSYQQLDMNDLMPTFATNATTTLSGDNGQIDTTKLKTYSPGVSDAYTADAGLIDTSKLLKADSSTSTAYNAPSTQIDLSQYQRANAPAANVTQANASLVDRNSNPYLNQTTAPISFNETNKFAGMNNPYLQAVIDYATGDIARNFNNNVQNSTDAMMARSGAFGGSAWAAAQAENNRQYANELGRTVGGMRMSDFQTQQQLEEARINRLKDIAIQNQNTSRLDLDRNAGLYSSMAIEDARNLTDVSKFNAGEQNAAYLQDANNAYLANKNYADTYNLGINKNADLMQSDNQYNATNNQANSENNANRAATVNNNFANVWNSALTTNANNTQNNNQYNATNKQNNSNDNANRVDAANSNYASIFNTALGANANNAMNNAQWNAGAQNTTSENNANRDTNAWATFAKDWNRWKESNNTGINNATNNNVDILNANALNNANALKNTDTSNVNIWNNTLKDTADKLTDISKSNAGLLYDYWNTANSNFMNATSNMGNWMNDSRYNDISKLNDVGSSYRDYAQGLINENLANFNNKNSWAQNQNDKLGNTVNAAGGLNNTSTGNTTVPANTNPWGTIGGLFSVGGGLLGSWGNQQGGGGGGSGLINPNNTSIFNATNSWLPNYGWK